MAQVKKARRKATATRKNANVSGRSRVPRVHCVGLGDDPASWTSSGGVPEPVKCLYDTNGDGDCHRCHRRGGCKTIGGPFYETGHDLEEGLDFSAILKTCCSITDGCINPASSFENIFVEQTCNVAIAGYSTDYDGPLAIQVRLDWLATAATGAQELLRLMTQMQYVDRNCEAIAKAMKPVCERAIELMGLEDGKK